MILTMRLVWVAAALLLWSPHAQARNVTHEDIRDAMLSLVHMFRTSEDKLERHEYREKALGEQLKKMLGVLDKKHRALEPLKGMISRLDERLSNVETILLQSFQKEQREKSTQKATEDALDGIQKSLQSLTASVGKKPADLDNNLTTDDDPVGRRLDATDLKIDAVKKEIENLKNALSKDNLRSMCLDAALDDGHPFNKHMSDAEKLLNKYELKLSEYNGTRVQTDFVPLSEVSLADEAWHSKMTEVMERQEKEVKKIQQLLGDAESMWKDLPRLADLRWSTNLTLDAVAAASATLTENNEQGISKVVTKLRELSDRMTRTNEDIQQSLTQGNTLSERALTDISRNYIALHAEVQALAKDEHVMQSTADNVLATKKRIEYGVHQILVEVGELVRAQGSRLNKSVSDRFDSIELKMIENHAAALSNTSAKIESEMSQVWRQIGVMYQQMTANQRSLDKLTEQTDQYVNTTATTLDGMQGKVINYILYGFTHNDHYNVH
ncbi:putative leucine-rich repeat-containing protein DDB_G0290503 isoform X1 [Leguminivora glycinivorella]|uniref:putative leucine-rich repeat-containing protein DDB_G0290503 isoform X1 n=1 Tax=Leguminivora glycinivorella TaxID=1035111 RepID=UPI00200DB5DE|nr:putative leucine-rich repeat-containing protein DDB_G0290503 isoform X1 [Leguminivora glycinivorella]